MQICKRTFFIIFIAISFTGCVVHQAIQYYPFPEDIAEQAKVENTQKIEKGRILYNINCAGCHNKKEGRKIILPDFTEVQLETYTIRLANETHSTAIPENKVTAEELEEIRFFFLYKKPSKPVTP